MDEDGILGMVLVSVYILMGVGCLLELGFSINLFREGKLKISFRLIFFFFAITLCLVRIAQIFSLIYIQTVSNFLQTTLFLRLLGNILFFCSFLTILFIFSKALKFSSYSSLRFAEPIGIFSFLCVLLSQLSLLISIEIILHQTFKSFTEADAQLLGLNLTHDGQTPSEQVFDDAQVIIEHSRVHYLHDAAFMIDAVFSLFVGSAFLVAGVMLFKILKEGHRYRSDSRSSHASKISLATKMLIVSGVMGTCMIARIGFLSVAISHRDFDRTRLLVVDYMLTELIPFGSFLLSLYTTRHLIQTHPKGDSSVNNERNSMHLSSNTSTDPGKKKGEGSKESSIIDLTTKRKESNESQRQAADVPKRRESRSHPILEEAPQELKRDDLDPLPQIAHEGALDIAPQGSEP